MRAVLQFLWMALPIAGWLSISFDTWRGLQEADWAVRFGATYACLWVTSNFLPKLMGR